MGHGRERMGEKIQGSFKKYKLVGTKRQGDVKNSTGNEVAKELIHMAHGHNLRQGLPEAITGTGWRVAMGAKLGPL